MSDETDIRFTPPYSDIIGWLLLALSIALASAGKQLTVVYILLALAGWMLFLIFAVRPALNLLARKTGSYGPGGPSQNWVCAALVMSLVSAFFCECIGIVRTSLSLVAQWLSLNVG
jgi:Kef-type K+ transport system membrane component KefB